MKKKKNKISAYFDACVINNYTLKQKLKRNFLKETSGNFNIPIFICRNELKKARIRLYNKTAYLKKSEKIEFLSIVTAITKKTLIEGVLQGDIELTKKGMAKFLRIFNVVHASSNIKRIGDVLNHLKIEEEKKYSWLDIGSYLAFLCKEINKISPEGYVCGAALNDSVFFSTYSLAETLIEFANKVIPLNERKKILRFIVRKLRESNILAEKINEDYYSNTVLIEFTEASVKGHGIFIKKSVLSTYFDFNKSRSIKDLKSITVTKGCKVF